MTSCMLLCLTFSSDVLGRQSSLFMSLLDRMLFDQQDEALIMGEDPAQDNDACQWMGMAKLVKASRTRALRG